VARGRGTPGSTNQAAVRGTEEDHAHRVTALRLLRRRATVRDTAVRRRARCGLSRTGVHPLWDGVTGGSARTADTVTVTPRHSCGLESGVTGSHSPELAGSMPLLPDGWCGHDPPVTSRDGNQPVVFLFRPVTSIGVAHSGERAPARRTCSAPTRAYPPSCGGSPVVGW